MHKASAHACFWLGGLQAFRAGPCHKLAKSLEFNQLLATLVAFIA
jgi:hypothetical protein